MLLVVLMTVALAAVTTRAFLKVRQSSRDRAVMFNLARVEGAAHRFFVDNPDRLFVGYDEIVGAAPYAEAVKPILDEDYHVLFPIRRDDTDSQSMALPVGRTVRWGGPPETWPDGVHTTWQPDRSRLETTWLHGVPDGPFRAYRPDGALWGEATYVKGRVVGPVWHYSRDGRKRSELTDGMADRRDGDQARSPPED